MALPTSLFSDAAEPSQAEAEINQLLALHPKGFDLSLDRIRRLLSALGNPQDHLPPVIHIAGTNGKGSATAFCRAALEASGQRVHVHTSPHLVRWHERFRLAATPGSSAFVDDDTLAQTVRHVANANNGEAITVFELLSAVMFVLFAEHPADAAIVEVGLGGRFDATNVIPNPAVSLIMPVSMDHEAFLGDTPEKIAFEKAGIIKPGVPVVVGAQPFEGARAVIENRAAELRSMTTIYGQDFYAYEEHGRMVFQLPDGLLDLPMPALAGRHQLANAAAAMMAVREAGFPLDEVIANQAVTHVSWPARMQKLARGALAGLAPEGSEIWVDGGHNPDAARMAAEFLADCEDTIERPLFLVAGMLNTKDTAGYFSAFKDMARHVFCVPVPSSDAGVAADVLAAQAMEAGLSAEPVQSVAAALSLLGDSWQEPEPAPRILIGGSLYLAGDVLRDNGTPPQ